MVCSFILVKALEAYFSGDCDRFEEEFSPRRIGGHGVFFEVMEFEVILELMKPDRSADVFCRWGVGTKKERVL